jgi:hypothetical protein
MGNPDRYATEETGEQVEAPEVQVEKTEPVTTEPKQAVETNETTE